MEQTITICTNRTTHLTVATLRVYQCLKDKLQDRAEVVDYRKIADEICRISLDPLRLYQERRRETVG